jgi:tetratricopeptide (TPR) repeat protein
LRWAARETQFGSRPACLSWSADGGGTWQSIAEVSPRAGENDYSWKVPPGAAGDILVRLQAWDLSGHEASAVVSLKAPVVPAPGAPASEEPGAAVAEAGEQEPGAKGEGEPESDVVPATAHVEEGGAVFPGGTEPAPREEPEVAAERVTPVGELPISLEPLEVDCLAGGQEQSVLWRITSPVDDPQAPVVLEFSPDGGRSWEPGAEASLASSGLQWRTPEVTVAHCRLRLLLPLGGQEVSLAWPDEFAIDADPPSVALEAAPGRAGSESRFPVKIEDPGCAGPDTVRVFVRPAGQPSWRELEARQVQLDGEGVILDLGGLEEGDYDVSLAACDRVGNCSAVPGEGSEAQGRFALDLTPPRVTVKPPVFPWVAGFTAAVQVEFDASDCEPPLLLEGREPGGEWKELNRLQSLTGGETTVEFPLPASARQYELRVSLADAAGNRGEALLPPRELEGAIQLVSFRTGRPQVAYSTEVVRWILHPVTADFAGELRVRAEHRAGSGSEWKPFCEVKPPLSYCDWDLPAADSEEHRIRVQLYRGDELLGEDVSPAFALVGVDRPLPTPVAPSPESVAYLEEARSAADRYREAVRVFQAAAGGAPSPGGGVSRADLAELARKAKEKFRQAIEADPQNYHATYGLAQLLDEVDREGARSDILRYLLLTLEIQPAHHQALNDLGALYIRAADYAEAAQVLEKSIEVQPSGMAHYNLGLAYLYQSRTADARQQFRRALEDEADLPTGNVHYYWVYSYILDEDLAQARKFYEEKKATIPEELRGELESKL